MSAPRAPSEEPAEHRRFRGYLGALASVPDTDETDLVTRVLADPDQAMAQGAVVRHLDCRAADLYPGPAYEPWAQSMTRTTSGYPFLERRLRARALFRAITLALP